MAGTAHPILIHGEPVLHRPADPVVEFDESLAELVEDMFASMYVAQGVGLAAPQIGVGLAVFVYDCHDDDGIYYKGHMINPEVMARGGGIERDDEGCLSVPGPFAPVARDRIATVRGFDIGGKPIEITGSGFFARCLLHETDHLMGTLFVDHLSKRRRARVLRSIEWSSWNAALPS
jgi:peptide deformylase